MHIARYILFSVLSYVFMCARRCGQTFIRQKWNDRGRASSMRPSVTHLPHQPGKNMTRVCVSVCCARCMNQINLSLNILNTKEWTKTAEKNAGNEKKQVECMENGLHIPAESSATTDSTLCSLFEHTEQQHPAGAKCFSMHRSWPTTEANTLWPYNRRTTNGERWMRRDVLRVRAFCTFLGAFETATMEIHSKCLLAEV